MQIDGLGRQIIKTASSNTNQLKKITDTYPTALDAANSINKNSHSIFQNL